MADSFFSSFAKQCREHERAIEWLGGPAVAGKEPKWIKKCDWFEDHTLMEAAGEFHALAKREGLQKAGIIMNSVTPEPVTPAGLPAVQTPVQQAAQKVMRFMSVGAPPVFIALLTPWVWLGWSLSLYLETASSVVAGLGLCTLATNGILARRRRKELAEQRYAELTPDQQSQAVTIDQALDRLEHRGRQYGDAEVTTHIQHITQSIRTVLPVLVMDKGHDAELYYTIRQTVLDYLPTTLDTYQRIPVGADHNTDQSPSPRQLLLDQLKLIDANIGQLVSQITENGRDALQANGRFLQERFRTQDRIENTPQASQDE